MHTSDCMTTQHAIRYLDKPVVCLEFIKHIYLILKRAAAQSG